MKKCRVLELIGGSLTDGGAETLVKDYVMNLDKNRFEAAVFVDWTISETANTKILTEKGQLIYTAYPGYSLFWRGINRFFRKTFIVRGIRKAIREFNPDVIHVHLNALQYLTMLGDELKGRKLFYTCHSTVEAMLVQCPEEDKAARELVHRYGLRFIALHDAMANELNARYGVDDTTVLNNGIDIDRFRHVKETKKEIRDSIGIPDESFVVGHVGRFVPVKNHEFILKIFKRVIEIRPDSVLLLVGDGEGLDDFKNKVAESGLNKCVVILSNRTDVPQLLKAMDVFLFPSLFEGLGNALIEAQAAGIRCVASKNVPESAFVSDLVYPMDLSDSLEKWCDAVLDTNKHGVYNDRMGEYDIKSSVRELERLYLKGKTIGE